MISIPQIMETEWLSIGQAEAHAILARTNYLERLEELIRLDPDAAKRILAEIADEDEFMAEFAKLGDQ